jgi:hypothetical protein
MSDNLEILIQHERKVGPRPEVSPFTRKKLHHWKGHILWTCSESLPRMCTATFTVSPDNVMCYSINFSYKDL